MKLGDLGILLVMLGQTIWFSGSKCLMVISYTPQYLGTIMWQGSNSGPHTDQA